MLNHECFAFVIITKPRNDFDSAHVLLNVCCICTWNDGKIYEIENGLDCLMHSHFSIQGRKSWWPFLLPSPSFLQMLLISTLNLQLLLKVANRLAVNNNHLTLQQSQHVSLLHQCNIDLLQVRSCTPEVQVLGMGNNKDRVPSVATLDGFKLTRLVAIEREIVNNHELILCKLGRESDAKSHILNLAGQLARVVSRLGSERHST